MTQTELKERGWTMKAIRDFAGPPDKQVPNPIYRSGAPVNLWLITLIEEVEASSAYQNFCERNQSRRDAALVAAETKRVALLKELAHYEVVVPVMKRRQLVRAACDHYNHRVDEYNTSGKVSQPKEWATPKSGPTFLDRICVNYLRHICTSYDEQLEHTRGRVGCDEGYVLVCERIFDAIGTAYPFLKVESDRQLAERVEDEDDA